MSHSPEQKVNKKASETPATRSNADIANLLGEEERHEKRQASSPIEIVLSVKSTESKNEETSKSDKVIDVLVKLLPILTAIIGGFWVLYKYLVYESILNSDQLIKSRVDALFAQQNALNAQQLAKANIQTAQAQATLAQIQTQTAKSPEYQVTPNIVVTKISDNKDGTKSYDFKPSFTIKNMGQSRLRIAYVIMDAFVGHQTNQLQPMFNLSEPPSVFTNPKEHSDVHWTLMERTAWESSDQSDVGGTSSAFQIRNGELVTPRGRVALIKSGGTLAPGSVGETSDFSPEYILKSQPGYLVGFVLNLGIMDGNVPEEHYAYRSARILSDSPASKS